MGGSGGVLFPCLCCLGSVGPRGFDIVIFARSLLEFLDRQAQPARKRREFAASEQQQEDEEYDEQLGATETEHSQRKRGSMHVGEAYLGGRECKEGKPPEGGGVAGFFGIVSFADLRSSGFLQVGRFGIVVCRRIAALASQATMMVLAMLSGWDARLLRTDAAENDKKDAPEGRAICREERDDKSVFFLDHVPAGTWEIRFGMRATTPGDYRALPVEASAMYVPEVRANSGARRVRIDAPHAPDSN